MEKLLFISLFALSFSANSYSIKWLTGDRLIKANSKNTYNDSILESSKKITVVLDQEINFDFRMFFWAISKDIKKNHQYRVFIPAIRSKVQNTIKDALWILPDRTNLAIINNLNYKDSIKGSDLVFLSSHSPSFQIDVEEKNLSFFLISFLKMILELDS